MLLCLLNSPKSKGFTWYCLFGLSGRYLLFWNRTKAFKRTKASSDFLSGFWNWLIWIMRVPLGTIVQCERILCMDLLNISGRIQNIGNLHAAPNFDYGWAFSMAGVHSGIRQTTAFLEKKTTTICWVTTKFAWKVNFSSRIQSFGVLSLKNMTDWKEMCARQKTSKRPRTGMWNADAENNFRWLTVSSGSLSAWKSKIFHNVKP